MKEISHQLVLTQNKSHAIGTFDSLIKNTLSITPIHMGTEHYY